MEKNYQLRSVPRMFEEVSRQIIAYIHEEELEKGAKLPTERKLSELLGVSRSSVREGLRILELLKYLESRQGGGTFVSIPPPFLIPSYLLSQSTDRNTLQQYFEVGLLNAEKIISLSLEQQTSVNLSSHQHETFWKEFTAWINQLGSQLPNPYYLSLWNNIYHLLAQNDFFKTLAVPMSLDDLKIAFYKKEHTTINRFFSSFNKG